MSPKLVNGQMFESSFRHFGCKFLNPVNLVLDRATIFFFLNNGLVQPCFYWFICRSCLINKPDRLVLSGRSGVVFITMICDTCKLSCSKIVNIPPSPSMLLSFRGEKFLLFPCFNGVPNVSGGSSWRFLELWKQRNLDVTG